MIETIMIRTKIHLSKNLLKYKTNRNIYTQKEINNENVISNVISSIEVSIDFESKA